MSCASVIGIARRRIFPEILPSPKSWVSADLDFGEVSDLAAVSDSYTLIPDLEFVLFLCK